MHILPPLCINSLFRYVHCPLQCCFVHNIHVPNMALICKLCTESCIKKHFSFWKQSVLSSTKVARSSNQCHYVIILVINRVCNNIFFYGV